MSPPDKEARLTLAARSRGSESPNNKVDKDCAESERSSAGGLVHPRLIDMGLHLQDPFHSKCINIIDHAFAVARTAAELSDAPTSAEIALRLKELARSLKRRCNQLTYKLAKTAKL
jgi:hypothetical protein